MVQADHCDLQQSNSLRNAHLATIAYPCEYCWSNVMLPVLPKLIPVVGKPHTCQQLDLGPNALQQNRSYQHSIITQRIKRREATKEQ